MEENSFDDVLDKYLQKSFLDKNVSIVNKESYKLLKRFNVTRRTNISTNETLCEGIKL